jgi:MFS family permease
MIRAALPAGRDARRILMGTVFLSVGTGLTLPFLLVYLTQVRGLPAAQVGLLVAWTGAIGLAFSPLAGTLIDRLGARRVTLSLTLVMSAGTASLAFVDSLWTAVSALTATGLSGAALWAADDTILASLVTESERQKTFGFAFALLNFGFGVGGMIASTFVDVTRPGTFQVLYLANAATFLVPAAILLSLPHVGRPSPPQLSISDSAPKGSGHGGYGRVLRDRAFVAFFLFGLVLATVGYAQIEVGFTAFATEVARVPPRVIAWSFAGNTTLIVLCQLFVLRWLDGRSRTRALALAGVMFAVAWSSLGLAGVAGAHARPQVAAIAVIAFGVIFAIGETMMTPILPTITNALAPNDLRGRYNALASMIFGLSGIIGPATAGPLIGGGHGALWLELVVGGSLVAAAMALWLRRRLTPAQDGRVPATVEPTVGSVASSEPVTNAVAG